MLLIAWLAPAAIVLLAPWPLIGLVPALIGFSLAVRGSRQFAQVETNIVPFTAASSLVTTGVFRYSRNPMYLGMVLFLAGTALLLNHMALWLIVVAFSLWLRLAFIGKEEQQMVHTFGDKYLAYRAKVRRWL